MNAFTYAHPKAPSKVYGPSDQAWLPKRPSYALRAKAKEAHMPRKTNAKSARVSVSQRHGRFWKFIFQEVQSKSRYILITFCIY